MGVGEVGDTVWLLFDFFVGIQREDLSVLNTVLLLTMFSLRWMSAFSPRGTVLSLRNSFECNDASAVMTLPFLSTVPLHSLLVTSSNVAMTTSTGFLELRPLTLGSCASYRRTIFLSQNMSTIVLVISEAILLSRQTTRR